LTLRVVSAYSRNQVSFDGVFQVGECMTETGAEVEESTGVVGGFEEACAMDATLEIICERCARSLPMMLVLYAEGNSGRRV
jgi:hypothetical protein